MRVNEPITQHEYELPDDVTLMSTTDASSHITYANAAFIAVSGFSRDELHGQAHNIVRHPDMPKEAFADMWATLKGGEPWTALVKNRRKNGDHYWVRANAVPVIRNGQQMGYMSVRTKASVDDIKQADKLYRDMREGRAGHLRIFKGLVVHVGWMSWRSLLQTMSVRWRIRSTLLLVLPLMMLGAWLGGRDMAACLLSGSMMVVAACLAAAMLEWQIAKPLEEVRVQALGVATGESQKAVYMNRVDDIGMTLRTISQLGLMFRWLIDDVSQQVRTVQTASSEIAQGNNDLSARTEQAAASVQETASSMEQMTSTVKSNADAAIKANELSAQASDAAARGGRTVSDVVGTMKGISSSSRKISDIIGVIDGIAFQTNILALNAAVEAARAGEQGRGFAVVAGEVRSLAQRSAAAAKEIKALIGESVEGVEGGSKIVDDAGRTMDDIVTQVRHVTALIGEISASTRDQSTGITQVNQAIAHLDQITQQNAALVEQSAAASQSLQEQTTRLGEAIDVFR